MWRSGTQTEERNCQFLHETLCVIIIRQSAQAQTLVSMRHQSETETSGKAKTEIPFVLRATVGALLARFLGREQGPK